MVFKILWKFYSDLEFCWCHQTWLVMKENILVLPYVPQWLFRCDMFQGLVYWKLLQTVFLSKANNVEHRFFHDVSTKLSWFNLMTAILGLSVNSRRLSVNVQRLSVERSMKIVKWNQLPSILNFGPGEWLFVKFLCLTPKLYAGAIFFRLSCICGFPKLFI